MPAKIGDPVTLPCLWWDAEVAAQEGDLLRTRTGRTYLIVGIRGRRFDCVVVPPDTETSGNVFEWTWARRHGRRRRGWTGT